MKKWIKLISIIILFASISLIVYFVLTHYGLTDIDYIRQIINSSREYGLIVFFILITFIPIIFCMIPLVKELMTFLGIILFGPLTIFLICIVSGLLSVSILFLIGDKLGEGFAKKLVGAESLDQAQNLINSKSKILLPILFTIPILPHDAITIVAGMTKLKYWYILLINMIHITIETAMICFFGGGIIDWQALNIIDWIVLINVVIIDIAFLLKLEKKFK